MTYVFPKPTSPIFSSVDLKSISHQAADLFQASLMNGHFLCRMKYEYSLYYTLKVKAVARLTK